MLRPCAHCGSMLFDFLPRVLDEPGLREWHHMNPVMADHYPLPMLEVDDLTWGQTKTEILVVRPPKGYSV